MITMLAIHVSYPCFDEIIKHEGNLVIDSFSVVTTLANYLTIITHFAVKQLSRGSLVRSNTYLKYRPCIDPSQYLFGSI